MQNLTISVKESRRPKKSDLIIKRQTFTKWMQINWKVILIKKGRREGEKPC